MTPMLRHDWTLSEVAELYRTPLLELVFQAAAVHRAHHDPSRVQVCKLISVKTGACPEDCAYCSQSSRYETEVKPTALMEREEVLCIAQRAKEAGASRVCLGAAWREVRDNQQFDRVLEMVRDVAELGLEVCCTLGMLNEDQARRLEEAGLYAYNHNIDTSARFYETIITTPQLRRPAEHHRQRSQNQRDGLLRRDHRHGRNEGDRLALLHQLATIDPHPESVPINILAKVPGTPMADQPDVPIWETGAHDRDGAAADARNALFVFRPAGRR